jgi:hypothetical protein
MTRLILDLITLIFCLIFSGPLALAESNHCQNDQVYVDHQCVNLGNKVNFTLVNVYSVSRGYLNKETDGTTIVKVVGRGYSSHLGGFSEAPIPLTLSFELKDGSSSKIERLLNQVGACYQSAALSMSSKEKYLFNVEVASEKSLTNHNLAGENGIYSIYLIENSKKMNPSYTIQCENSLKSS